MAGSSLIGNLAVSLSMETAAFQKSASLAETRVAGMQAKFAGFGKGLAALGAGLAGGLIIGGITSAATGAFELGSALSEAAEKMGVTVEGLQRLRVAARETGVSNEQLDGAMVKLNKSLGELQLGTKSAVDAYAQIGLSADELKGKSPDQALRLIADALNKIPDPQQRIAIGSDLMGKSFAQLVPMISGGSAALEKYAQQSKASGEVSDANAKKLDELADRWEGFKVTVGVATANIIAASISMGEKVGGSMTGLSESMVKVHDAIAGLARGAVEWVNNMVTGISQAITGRLNAIWDGAKARIQAVKKEFYDLYDAVVGHSYIPDMVEGIGRSMADLGKVLVDPSISATAKVGAVFQNLGQVIGSVFGNSKVGGILGAIGQFATALAPLFSKAAPTQGFTGPAMAKGGSGTFGGRSGVDKNLLSVNGSPVARVSKGEHFRVSPNGGGGSRVQVVPSPYFDVVVDRRASNVAAPMAGQAAVMGAQGGAQAISRRGARMLPR